jgi:hypothetical protein
VVIDDDFGLRITEVNELDPTEDDEGAPAAAAQEAPAEAL